MSYPKDSEICLYIVDAYGPFKLQYLLEGLKNQYGPLQKL